MTAIEAAAIFRPAELPPYSMEEVMEMLDCTESEAKEHASAGRLPGLKWGKRWVFPRGAFHKAINDRAMAESEARARAHRSREATRARRKRMAATIRFHAAKRRAARLQRTPPWSDLDAMRTIYREAQRLTRETGIPHHVDHVIPLQGVLVSGLHVHQNLQILTGSENSKKRNRFEIEP